jgi:hypothetical protein
MIQNHIIIDLDTTEAEREIEEQNRKQFKDVMIGGRA